jgi:hypothetical protein
MKIWHDDLGIQNDPHEMKVLWIPKMCRLPPIESRVTGGDAAAAMLIMHSECAFSNWYQTVRDLLLAGF